MSDVAAILSALRCTDPTEKCAQVAALSADLAAALSAPARSIEEYSVGRPDKPELVRPRDVPLRGIGSVEGRAGLCHAVAHIEFNAINLALDAAYRFADMPQAYYADWISVAQDEARHFLMMAQRLNSLGFAYGDFCAHNGLWEAAEKTAHDVLVRMACVPRVLEARGLDVTPNIIRRLREVRDSETVAVLEIILAEEVRHVAIGSYWFNYCCELRGLASEPTFHQLLAQYGAQLRAPFNMPARLAAGFTASELAPYQ